MSSESPAERTTLAAACDTVLRRHLAARPGERVLVVWDAPQRALAEAFERAAREITPAVRHIEIPVAPVNNAEPPPEAAAAMLTADVLLLPTSQSISWTRARSAASRAGARIASMPRLTADILERCFAGEDEGLRARVATMADRLDAAERVRLETAGGAVLELGIAGRHAHGRKAGFYTEPGQWGNLPCGEAFIAPVEGSAEGCYVVDGSHAGVGLLEEPITFRVEAGLVRAIEGGAQARELARQLASVGDERAYNLAELGIGANARAAIHGIVLEDEKALGTCHLALGNNAHFGGRVSVGIHVDGVIRAPRLWLDDELVLDHGHWPPGAFE